MWSEAVQSRKENHVGEDREKKHPEAETWQRDDDVEAHKVRPEAEEREATEEGPDVEAHKVKP